MQHGPLWKCFSPHWKKYAAFSAFGKTVSVLLELWPYVENMSQVKTFLNESATMVVLVQVCESKHSHKMKDNLFQRPTNLWQLYFYPLLCSCETDLHTSSSAGWATSSFQRLYLYTLSDNTLLVFQEYVLWLACLHIAVAHRKLAIPTGAVCFAPHTSHRNCKLPKTTHLLNEFSSAPVLCPLLPRTLLFNWSALFSFLPPTTHCVFGEL